MNRLVIIAFAAAALVISAPTPAGAQSVGSCSGSATIEDSSGGPPVTVDLAEPVGTIVIPRAGTVVWQGGVPGPPGDYSGSVSVALPAPFGGVTVQNWGGTTETTSNNGDYSYDIPSIVPAGSTITVKATHTDANGSCSGSFDLTIAGSTIASPLAWGSLVLTVLAGGGLAALLAPLVKGGR